MKEKHEKLRAKYLTEYIYEKHNQDKCLGFIDGFEKAIQALSQSEWISVEDRLPELYEFVFVFADCERKISRMIDNEIWYDVINVTHWMPLPQKPQTK